MYRSFEIFQHTTCVLNFDCSLVYFTMKIALKLEEKEYFIPFFSFQESLVFSSPNRPLSGVRVSVRLYTSTFFTSFPLPLS
jgi:hypothetical protein